MPNTSLNKQNSIWLATTWFLQVGEYPYHGNSMWLQRYLWEANKIYSCIHLPDPSSSYLFLFGYECNHWNNTQTMNLVQVKTILACEQTTS